MTKKQPTAPKKPAKTRKPSGRSAQQAAPSEPAAKKAKGRPRGSKNVQRDECDVITSRCKRCGSSKRKPYQSDPTTLEAGGVDPITGAPYTHVIWRRTACKQCGQARIDKCYEFRNPAADRSTDAA
jgi:hypothetical protein